MREKCFGKEKEQKPIIKKDEAEEREIPEFNKKVALETSGNRYRVGYVTGNKLIYLGLKLGEFELIRMLVDVRRDYRLAKYFKFFLKEVKIDIDNLPVTKSSDITTAEFTRTRQSDVEKEAAVFTANNSIN